MSKVFLFAAASRIDESQIESCSQRFADLGLTVELQVARAGESYHAASAKACAKALHQAFLSKEVSAIIAFRGGFGSARLLPLLDYQLIQAHPKLLMGFSDITALLNTIYLKTGLITWHGPCANQTLSEESWQRCQQLLLNQEKFSWPLTQEQVLKSGKTKGRLLGGNLAVLNSLLATPYLQPNWSEYILCLEDVGEDIYRLDRLLLQLKLAGVLSQIKGLMLGSFTQLSHKLKGSYQFDEMLAGYVEIINGPVLWNLPFGHQADNYPWPVGALVELDTAQQQIK